MTTIETKQIPVIAPIERISDMDIFLSEIGMDISQAKDHPLLFIYSESELSSRIDAIYIAANAGFDYAKLLIEAAAKNQVELSASEIDALDSQKITVDEIIDLTEINYKVQEQERKPLDNLTAAAELGCLITKLEFSDTSMQQL